MLNRSLPVTLIAAAALALAPALPGVPRGSAQEIVHGVGINANQPEYRVGETIALCFTAPVGTYAAVVAILPGGSSSQLFAGEAGGGGCVDQMAGPATGLECVYLTAFSEATLRQMGAAHICFDIVS
jgi:hypothetical protein